MNPRWPTPALPEPRWPNLAPPPRRSPGQTRPARLDLQDPLARRHRRALAAGILHVTATLAVPLIGPGMAYQKLRELLPANTMVVVPPALPGKQLLPFLMPDAYYGICRYSLASEPITVSAPLADLGWTLRFTRPMATTSTSFQASSCARRTFPLSSSRRRRRAAISFRRPPDAPQWRAKIKSPPPARRA